MSVCEEQRRYRFRHDASMIQSNSPLPSMLFPSLPLQTSAAERHSSLTLMFISRCLGGTLASLTNQRQNQFHSHQYVTFAACLSVQSPFCEHSLNTDLARDNVLLATPAGSKRSIGGANHVGRASFFPSI